MQDGTADPIIHNEAASTKESAPVIDASTEVITLEPSVQSSETLGILTHSNGILRKSFALFSSTFVFLL